MNSKSFERSDHARSGDKADGSGYGPLSCLDVGRCAYVVSIEPHADRDLKRRLLEMGFCNGASVECIRRAPLGDPIEFKLRGYNLSLRSDQARYVKVTAIR
ncbi:MAG: hypothetical protein KatS3mg104_0079 [Phycisphaerae bacterium]|jgi:ferrous iron transport protein A|nr:MAG: hypothetical protein KatS3mg104_0079 [Phycisphaerae bacterium]